MADIFVMKLDQIQPSQLFVSSEKLSDVLRDYDRLKPELLEPLPVKKLGEEIVLTDCHTIALAAHLRGISDVRVYWDDEESDWEAYQICVDWCKKEGVHSIADLKKRVVPAKEFEVLWRERCKKMVQDLEAKRNDVTISVIDPEGQELPELE
jgi:adenosyl cobinamide kinase/adenosyl cobinamide phosphate guanylyltransferase